MSKQSVDETVEALDQIRGGSPLERVYLFYGSDDFLLDRLVEAVCRRRFGDGPVDALSLETYRACETDVGYVLDSVRTVSMFGGAKVVVYRDVEKLCESDRQKIVEYSEHPVRAHLILVAAKIDLRRKSWTLLKKRVRSVSCAPLTDRTALNYVMDEAKVRHVALERHAAEALVNFVGPNRSLIERALEKLSLAVPSGTKISPEIVEEHVVDVRERSVFELTKAVTERDVCGALSALRVLLDQRQEPVMINGLLARHARLLLQVKLGLSRRMSEAEIAEQAGINAYAMREYMSAMPKYSLADLYRFYASVYEADRALKSKPVPASLVLSKVLVELA